MADDKPTTITSLGDLHLDNRNANRGTARGRQALAEALRDHGAGRSILVDHAGRVVAGNKVAAEAAALHLPVTVVRTSGDRLVIVQRTDLDLATDPKARQLALADNRVGELNLEWDDALLREFANEGLAFDALWTDEELEQRFGEGLGRGQTDADAVIEPGATNIVPGDLFALGDHRLLCGDATVAADVARVLDGAKPALMVTDPPYGVAYDPAWRAAAQPHARTAVGRVANDDRVDWSDAFALFPGSTVYLWHAGIHAEAVAASLRRCEFVIRSQIVWVKQHFALSRGHYHWQHEPCWYAVRTGQSANWCGSRTQSTVWQVPNLNPHGGQREGENAVTGHSTQKPVRLFEVPILNHTGRGEAVYEPFCGSGTALIAAEKTGRRCLAIELDPRYVHAAITRWEAYSGTRATRLSAGGGR